MGCVTNGGQVEVKEGPAGSREEEEVTKSMQASALSQTVRPQASTASQASTSRDFAAFAGSRAAANQRGRPFPWLPHCLATRPRLPSALPSFPHRFSLLPVSLPSNHPSCFHFQSDVIPSSSLPLSQCLLLLLSPTSPRRPMMYAALNSHLRAVQLWLGTAPREGIFVLITGATAPEQGFLPHQRWYVSSSSSARHCEFGCEN